MPNQEKSVLNPVIFQRKDRHMRSHKCVMGLSILFLSFGFYATAHAASIKGAARYEGNVPQLKEINMDADPLCQAKHDKTVYSQTLVLGDGNTMGNVFVRISGGVPQKDYPVPAEPVIISQQGCMYTPHVFGVMVGQPVKILNPDGTLHNVHALSKINAEFNIAMPQFRAETSKVFDKEEFMFPIKCDVHPWMLSWAAVMSHPFFAVTQADGQFTIDNLPAGTYEVEAWHEKLGTQKSSVTLAEGETKELNFTFSRPSE